MKTMHSIRSASAAAVAISLAMVAGWLAPTPAVALEADFDPALKGSITVTPLEPVALQSDVDFLFTLSEVQLMGTVGAALLAAEGGFAAADELAADVAQNPTATIADLSQSGDLFNLQSLNAGASGAAVFSDLAVGVYLVEPTHIPLSVAVSPAPFIVTMPLASSDEQGNLAWTTQITASPKYVSHISKQVDDSETFVQGNDVSWTITTAVPTIDPQVESLDTYTISDEIRPGLELSAAPTVVATNNAAASVPLEAATDYEVTTTFTDIESDGAEVVRGAHVAFTASGLDKLAGLGGGTVTVSIVTRVVDVAAGNGTLANTAVLQLNDNAPITSNEARTYWAIFNVHARDSSETPHINLAGGVYQVYLEEEGGEPLEFLDGDGNAVSQFTTADNGMVHIPGVKIDNDDTQTQYWVEQVRPPEGYTLTTFAGTDAAERVSIELGPNDLASVQQENLRQSAIFEYRQAVPEWVLPDTGGSGAMIYGFVGGALALIAVGVAVMTLRRRTDAAT